MITTCPCCGSTKFVSNTVLWDGLIKEWGLKKDEATYINRQQGYTCQGCETNLRSMMLAYAITQVYGMTFQDFLKSDIRILEINEAGHLNKYFKTMRNHTLVEYPEIDMMHLPHRANSFDLVVHSDTMEHISEPIKAAWPVAQPVFLSVKQGSMPLPRNILKKRSN